MVVFKGIKIEECLRCGKVWVPRKQVARQCPRCKSVWFDTPKKRLNLSK